MEKKLKNVLKLDPTSDRYRICPYCKKPHMVNHLGKDYCCDVHADKHYNEKRRLKKHAEFMLKEKQKVKVKEEEKINENGLSVDLPEMSVDEVKKNGIEKNVAVFDSMEVDPNEGSIYGILYLEGNGVDFKYYSYKINHEDSHEAKSSSYIIIKNYKIERVSKTEVRIIKKINFKN
jgi:hypothetical protein